MKLNETIRRLRRAKGLTQEQVAQALGVSAPAVNKWERGACCPDLALLAPLARLLDTDLNTLLSFREELTGAEIAAFTEELYTLAQSGGIDAAFLRAEELLHRWPGCDRLTISLAMTLNGLFFTLGVAEPEPYERRLEPLYRALVDSEEPDIRDQALHLLIGRHMRREEYAAAEELLSALSILMMHLSRFSEELILWCSWEFKFIELDDAYATGSSIMPQKKNPDVAELVRGKTGRVYGSLITLLTVMKGIPLAYNKDMQEDKEPVFDTIDTVELCLPVFTAMIDTLTVNRANMRAAANGGFISATDCADYLAKKGMPFREAYGIVGKLVGHCVDTGHSLETLPLEEYQKVSPYFKADVYDALSLETCVNGRKVYGGPAPEAVKVQIENMKKFVQEREA